MKILFKVFLSFFILTATISCKTQMVKTVDEIKRVEVSQKKFAGKPLSNLLKQIKPQIKRVIVVPGSSQRLTYLYFYFLSDSAFHRFYNETQKNPIELRVRLKGYNSKWDPSTQPQGHRFDWTKEDEEAFGKLTIVDIKVKNAN